MNRSEHHDSSALGLAGHPARIGLACALVIAGALLLVFQSDSGEDEAPPAAAAEPLPRTRLEPRPAPPSRPAGMMRREISAALGFTGNIPTAERIREIMEMRDPLTEVETEELLRALLAPRGEDEAAARHSTWFHEIANLLHRQDVDHQQFAEVLATVAADEARGGTVRDYALQHLRRVWHAAEDDSGLRESIEATFAGMASEGHPLRASALLSLHLLDPRGSRGAGPLENEVVRILSDSRASGEAAVHARMAAARIAGDRRLSESRGELLALAASDSRHALVRMVAVSALGRLGDPSDLRALEDLSSRDPRVAEVIRLTLAAAD